MFKKKQSIFTEDEKLLLYQALSYQLDMIISASKEERVNDNTELHIAINHRMDKCTELRDKIKTL